MTNMYWERRKRNRMFEPHYNLFILKIIF